MVEAPSTRFVSNILNHNALGTPEGRGSRMLGNAAVFGISTLVDLVESKAYRTVSNMTFEKRTKRLEDELHSVMAARSTHPEDQQTADDLQIKLIRDALRQHKAVQSSVDFAEEMLSDELLIAEGGHSIMKALAPEGFRINKSYVKSTADVISNYANTLIQVFGDDRWIGFMNKDGTPKKFLGMYMAEKSMNFINPFNTEAVLRILSDIPGVGKIVLPIKSGLDGLLNFEEHPVGKWINKTLAKLMLGYHVKNSMEKAVEHAKTS